AMTSVAAARAAPADTQASRLLELALLLTFVAHAIAMAAMAALLLPGMPGGGTPEAVRVAYIAAHPWLWRLGWSTWGATALSDVLLALALVRTPWVPRTP